MAHGHGWIIRVNFFSKIPGICLLRLDFETFSLKDIDVDAGKMECTDKFEVTVSTFQYQTCLFSTSKSMTLSISRTI